MHKNVYAATLTEQMDVQIGMFDAASITLNYNNERNQYNISTIVKTENLFNTLYPFYGKYESNGSYLPEKILPASYQTYTKSRNHIRTKKILYNDKGKAYRRISTKDNKENSAEIDNPYPTVDSADLQSVFAELISLFSKTNSCQLNREVYDGKKHYQLIANDIGQETRFFDLTKKQETIRLCAIYIKNLKENNDNILWDLTADKPIKVLIGQDKTTKIPFIVEINIDSTPLGALKVTPTALEIK